MVYNLCSKSVKCWYLRGKKKSECFLFFFFFAEISMNSFALHSREQSATHNRYADVEDLSSFPHKWSSLQSSLQSVLCRCSKNTQRQRFVRVLWSMCISRFKSKCQLLIPYRGCKYKVLEISLLMESLNFIPLKSKCWTPCNIVSCLWQCYNYYISIVLWNNQFKQFLFIFFL